MAAKATIMGNDTDNFNFKSDDRDVYRTEFTELFRDFRENQALRSREKKIPKTLALFKTYLSLRLASSQKTSHSSFYSFCVD